MSEYTQKTKQFIINSAKQPIYICRENIVLFNLNSCFVKKNNFAKYEAALKESIQKGGKKVNFGNFASLCYKLGIDYASKEALEFVEAIVTIAKMDKLEVVQNGILSYGETDMQPIDSLIKYDKQSNIIYTNQVLIDCLKILGYVESQTRDIIMVTKDFRKIIPEDLINELPIVNKKNIRAYEKIQNFIHGRKI